jgi:hypothetical protein
MPDITQLPAKETTPYSILDDQLNNVWDFYSKQEQGLKNTPLTDTDYNRHITELQQEYDSIKMKISTQRKQLDLIQQMVDNGAINPDAGQEAMYRLVLPEETQQAMFQKTQKPGTPRRKELIMKINLETFLVTLNGEVLEEKIKDKVIPIKLKSVCVNALLGMNEDDSRETGESKAARYKLALKLNEGGEQDLSTDEIVKIKGHIGKLYVPLIVGQAYDLLEGKNNDGKQSV